MDPLKALDLGVWQIQVNSKIYSRLYHRETKGYLSLDWKTRSWSVGFYPYPVRQWCFLTYPPGPDHRKGPGWKEKMLSEALQYFFREEEST